MRKVTYITEEDKQRLLLEAKENGERLVEEGNTIEGNYLVFTSEPLLPKKPTTEERLSALEEALLILLMEG